MRLSGANTPPMTIPGTQLTGAGAFMGPVRAVAVDGVRLAYRQFGHGPDLLMITGDTAPMSLWMPYLLRPLARHFRVTIFDNRGVGYSTDNPSVALSIPLMAKDTVGLIRALGLRRATVLGWSMGGEIGLTMAELYPHAFARLVITGGDAGSKHTVPPPAGLLAELSNPNAGPEVVLRLLFPATRAGKRATERFLRGYESIPQEQVSTTTLARQQQAESAFLRYGRTWAGLRSIRMPVLITNGALDYGVPPINAKRLHHEIHGSKLTIYAGAAHGMLFQDAAAFAHEVIRFARA